MNRHTLLVVLTIFGMVACLFAQGGKTDLGTIVVTATRRPTEAHKASANVTVISRQEIEHATANDLGELLQQYDQIKVGSNGDLGALKTVSIRGSTAEQVLVMIDGRPVNDTAFGVARLEQILLTNIEQVEIVRGGTSALYGANAVGGVVNIITRKASRDVPVIETDASIGSLNKRMYHLGLGINKNKGNYLLSMDRQLSDGYRDNENLKLNHAYGHVSYDFETLGLVTVKGDLFQSKTGVPGPNYTSIDQWDDTKEKAASTPFDRMENDKNYGLIEHMFFIGDT
ncbi:MAG: TonB-dependent receptor plug domain-containing protein, partial [Elusimicrobia bacterium]|nr:TonB-dependent receptor plug domain-containing protein [Elusimicrobiota bacterium]MBD3411764.1 TonB-dependent receptor plug domain-containing protein [Elusimicrobiota bacterium]